MQGQATTKASFLAAAEAMYEELHIWRTEHLDASVDELAEEVGKRRRVLMGQLLSELASVADERISAPACETCGGPMAYKGTPVREVLLGEGEMQLERAYFYCEACEGGLFPPGPPAGSDAPCVEYEDHPTGGPAGGGDCVLSACGGSLC